jgi:Ca2+/H+ antiporter, TMEM165/GDT1 family
MRSSSMRTDAAAGGASAHSAVAAASPAIGPGLWPMGSVGDRTRGRTYPLHVAFALTAVGAALAVALELLEALAIVLAVAVERRGREAAWGALAAVLACGALAVVVGPVLLARAGGDALRLVVGVALLLFGLEWLRKAVLRLAGRRARSDSYAEYVEEREALEALPPAPPTSIDWPAAVIAFKGVLLEGVEVVLIVSVLASRPTGAAPALLGAGLAVLLVAALGFVLHRPLRNLPETELKYVVGLVLTAFGTFFAAEGLGVEWPLGDGALVLVLAAWLAVSQALVRSLAPPARDRVAA